ncbi:hypothetical protein LCGC14_0249220 [marine sediment metagenome]|uniref:Uncharacterized protein n=1 Tax=marine sediment metagenome TaxID=412755 RepID=A0A0F9U9R1_9ZZZZ
MPLVVTSDWNDGPMGPGWFVMLPKNTSIFYDGGPMDDLLVGPEGADERKRQDELFALIMLMRQSQ